MSVRSRVAPSLTLLPLVLFALACPAPADVDLTVSEDDAARVVAEAICEAYYACACDSKHDNPVGFSSVANCEATLEGEAQETVDLAKAAELDYDATFIADWLDAIDDLGCQATWNEMRLSRSFESWDAMEERKLYSGTVAEGDACVRSSDVVDDCVPAMECDGDSAVCVPWASADLPVEGETCDGECAGALGCVDLLEDGDRTCEVLPTSGETCLGVGNLCEVQSYCDQGTKNCVPLPESGSDCAATESWAGQTCALYAVCNGSDVCVDGVEEGDSCDPAMPGTCQVGLSCDDPDGLDAFVCTVWVPIVCGVPWEVY